MAKKRKKENNQKSHIGFTLIEIIIAMAILAIVSLGAIGYQFRAVRQTRIGNTKMAAARIGSLILENWKSHGGSDVYDPTELDLGITKLTTFENRYLITLDNVSFYLTLSARDVDSNSTTGVTLRELSVFIQWNSDYQQEIPESSDPSTTFYTYVRQDQSGG